MKKHFSCFALIRFEILAITFVCLWILLFLLMGQGKASAIIMFSSGLYGIALLIGCLAIHNAFVRYSISEQGISNRWMSMRWEEIREYDIVEIKPRRFYGLFRKRVYCFGDIPNDSFWTMNPKRTIFFSITPKIMTELETMSKGRSAAINHISARYAGI